MSRIWIPAETTNATVVEIFPQRVRVRWDQPPGSEAETLCVLKRGGLVEKMSDKRTERSLLCVGDRVLADRLGVVTGVAERRNILARKAPDRDEGQIHVIASNVDRLVIVTSAQEPVFSTGIVDRYWIAAQAAGIAAELVVNKIDLNTESQAPWAPYPGLGLPVTELSAKHTPEAVLSWILKWTGQTVCFAGHSGVGKTTLLNAVRSHLATDSNQRDGKTGSVNVVTKKGSHTTSSSVLVWGDVRTIDTPGVRAFALVGVEPENLRDYFPELNACACEMRECDHVDRQGCAATELFRYPSYRRLHTSMLEERGD